MVVLLLVLTLSLFAWQLVHYAPRSLSMFLPRGLCYGIGLTLFLLGLYSAFFGAYGLKDPGVMLFAVVRLYVGLWFMLAPSAAARGSREDDEMLRRVFLMIGMVLLTIVASLYVPNMQTMAVLNLLLIAGGFWVMTNYLQGLNRGR